MNLRRYLRRAGELAVGHTANAVMVYGFDFVLYPVVMWQLGLVKGFAVMALLSLLVCLLTLWFYDWSGRDWLGIEAVKQLRDGEADSRFRKMLAWALSRSDWLACALLSIKFDAFITTAWMRRGAFQGMTSRDWRIFFASWLMGNGWWALACFGGIELLSRLWHALAG